MAIVVAILAVASLVFFIQDIVRLFQPSNDIIALMGDAGALDRGSPVWIAGNPVGLVKSVVIRGADVDSAERVAVTMEIPRKYQQNVRRDSKVRMTSARLIGEPVLDISPGSANSPILHDGDTLSARGRSTIEGLMDRSMVISNGLRGLFADMDAMKEVASIAPERFDRINTNLQLVTVQFRDLTVAMQNGPAKAFADPEFKAALSDLQNLAGRLSEAFAAAADRAGRARRDAEPALRRMSARADTIRTELSKVQNRITAGGGGLLLRAQKDSAIIKAVHGAQLQLDSLIAETKRNPLRFWF